MAAAAAATLTTIMLLPAGGFADNPAELRARSAELEQSEREARLELFALQTRLDGARRALSSVESRLASVEEKQVASRRQLAVAKRTLARAQELLADQVFVLYTQDAPDALAVFLGASSFEDALDSVDAVERSADATAHVLAQARSAKAKVRRLLRSLTARRAELRSLRDAAVARTRELAGAEGERLAYIGRLRQEQVLTEQQIAQAVAAAEAAQAAAAIETAKAQAAPSISSIGAQTIVEAAPPPPPPAAPPPPQPSPQAPVATSGKQLTVVATAYTTHGTTATGIPTGPGVVAVDPSVIPLGTRMTIPGYGEGVAADTGGAIKGLRIDVWVASAAEAAQWQWQTVTITLH